MLKPTLEKAKELTGYSVIPVCREILSDFTTPIEVLKKLRRVSRHVYILESVENQENGDATPSSATTPNWSLPAPTANSQ